MLNYFANFIFSNKIASQIRNLSYQLYVQTKSETIWRRVVKHEPLNMYKYKNFLKDLDNNDPAVKEYLYFPYSTFKSCPTDMLKSLISDSFAIVKEKKLINNVEVYNSILRSYVTNNINFDVDHLLQEMQDNKIQFNQETYSLFIEYYCNIGKMDNVEILLEEMNSKNKEISFDTQLSVIKGYIIAGQSEKSKKYIVKNNLNENDCNISKALLMGYASIGQIDIIMDIINKMKDNNIYLSGDDYFQLYLKLVLSKASDSHLEKILTVMLSPSIEEIVNIIYGFNRMELFDYSLKIVKIYKVNLMQSQIRNSLIQSFNTKNCQKEIYIEILTILLQCKCDRVSTNLFANMDYNESTIFANNIINNINARHLAASLVNKAINDKSINKLEMALDFARNELIDSRIFNSLFIYCLIPSIFESQMVSNCEELINLLPKFRGIVIKTSFLYCLKNKDFEQCDHLYSIVKYRHQHISINFHQLSREIALNYQSMEEFNNLSKYISLFFNFKSLVNIVAPVIVEKITLLSKEGDIETIREMVKYAENLNVLFTVEQLNFLMENADEHKNIFKDLLEMKAESLTKYG